MKTFQDFVHELNNLSTISRELYDVAKSAPESQWVTRLDQSVIMPPESILVSDPTVAKFIDKYKPGQRMLIFRNQPHSAYGWHKDANRKISLNMLLYGKDCITLVGEKFGIRTMINLNSMDRVYKAPMEENKFYLLNVEELHTVYNYGDEIRYILSISVPFPTDFNTVKAFAIENNW